ncbi:6-hydroxymethylpterin diphosphokinase MptE-like protein [Acetobacterium carbinolicum]|uniref:motility associated factor glycosyltransferase family protein n=1 Tax=Acetobacterium carbinolicum TaxID=52690 RepID=UPI0039BEFDC7
MLADNIVYLKKTYPDLYQSIKKWEEKKAIPQFTIDKAKDGNDTLVYHKDEQTTYLHSKYNPINEAKKIIEELDKEESISEDTHVVFYGFGLGYHIQLFCELYPNTLFTIVEPSIEVLDDFLNTKKLNALNLKNLALLQVGSSVEEVYNKTVSNKDKRLILCVLPVYRNLFGKEYVEFLAIFKKIARQKKIDLNTNYAFKKRWVVNSVNNFKEVLDSPNILMDHNGVFKGKTAILVAAGPSLDFEIENLKKIKDQGLAFIFSVGSAINALIHHEIYPHAMCTYDPTEKNQIVFKKVNELKIQSIPMIFGSSVGYEVLEQYSGPKYHMITNQDSIANYLLPNKDCPKLEIVRDAPSIAVVTLELLIKLGFEKIILVGQNLAYLKNKHFSEGITYIPEKIQNCSAITSVNGKMIETNETFLLMKKMLERTIAQLNVNVINTTIEGAKIEGTDFCELSSLIKEQLTQKIVNGDEFDRIVKSNLYNKKSMRERIKTLKISLSAYEDLIYKVRHDLKKLENLVKHQNKNQIIDTHNHMDRLIRTIEGNEFYTTIALPLNRVEQGILINQIQNLKQESNSVKKARGVIRPTEIFMDLLWSDRDLNERIMIALENTVYNYCREA